MNSIKKYKIEIIVVISILLSYRFKFFNSVVDLGALFAIVLLLLVLIKCIKDNLGRKSTWVCRPYKRYTKKTEETA